MNLNRLPVSEPQSGLVGAAGVSEPAENDGLSPDRIDGRACFPSSSGGCVMTWELIVLGIVIVAWGTVRLASTLFAWADEIERRERMRDDLAGLSVFGEDE